MGCGRVFGRWAVGQMQCGELTAEKMGWNGLWLDPSHMNSQGNDGKPTFETYLCYL
jgi:hypothetical protein